MEDCLFCKISLGEIPNTKIYEDEHTYAFLDINPTNTGHTLVIPKKHYENIHDLPEKELHEVMNTVKKLSPAIKKGVQADGLNISMNNGAAAGQIVFHSHTHIIPRFGNDGYKSWERPSNKEIPVPEEVAEKIQKEL